MLNTHDELLDECVKELNVKGTPEEQEVRALLLQILDKKPTDTLTPDRIQAMYIQVQQRIRQKSRSIQGWIQRVRAGFVLIPVVLVIILLSWFRQESSIPGIEQEIFIPGATPLTSPERGDTIYMDTEGKEEVSELGIVGGVKKEQDAGSSSRGGENIQRIEKNQVKDQEKEGIKEQEKEVGAIFSENSFADDSLGIEDEQLLRAFKELEPIQEALDEERMYVGNSETQADQDMNINASAKMMADVGSDAAFMTEDEAITLVKTDAGLFTDYPSNNLPLKIIITKYIGDERYVSFALVGSGRDAILSAKCYKVNGDGGVSFVGAYEGEGVASGNFDIAVCG